MSYKEVQNDKIKASLIKVEALQKEYEVTLQQYEEAVKNYIKILQSGSNNASNKYTALKGRAWWGNRALREGSVANKRECESMCANDAKCSGATFNPVKRYCWTRKGDGTLSVGETNDYALLPSQKSALIIMKSLNNKLLDINSKITSELKNVNPEVMQQIKSRNNKHQKLKKSYNDLLEQKMEMERQLKEYNSIDQENENKILYVNQQSLSLRFWGLITALIILFTIRRMYGSDFLPLSIIIWFVIILILIILTFNLSSPSGFAMWFVALIAIILMNMGHIPTP
jgi:chromosome segregation ATPase